MKDSGLGTPATRAAIIETLLKRGFIVRDRQHLLPTETGTGLIEALPVASLASPELTGTWEARLAQIARGQDSRGAFMADIARYVTELVDAIKRSTPAPPPANQPPPAWEARQGNGGNGARTGKRDARTPPRRASPESSTQRGTAMSPTRQPPAPTSASAPRGADTSPRRPSHATAPTSGSAPRGATPSPSPSPSTPRTSVPSSSRIGLHHDASIVAALRSHAGDGHDQHHRQGDGRDQRRSHGDGDDQRSRRGDDHGQRRPPAAKTPAKPPKAKAELRCPRCGAGTLLTGSRGWGCSRWREGCRFVVWFEVAGKKLTTTQLRELVTKGATTKKLAGGAARLVLDVRGDPSVRVQR